MARRLAALLTNLPTGFTEVVRSLVAEHEDGRSSMSASTQLLAHRLLRSPSVAAPLSFLVKATSEHEVEPPLSTAELRASFSLLELAFVFGLLMMNKQASRWCNAAEWKPLRESMSYDVAAALVVGRAVPAVGGAVAMIEASIRTIALATFIRRDVEWFRGYRRELKRTNTARDLGKETARWGCDSVQVGSMLLQTLGFGVERANGLLEGLREDSCFLSCDETARAYRMAGLWRRLVMRGDLEPTFVVPENYAADEGSLRRAKQRLDSLRGDNLSATWLERTRDDVGLAAPGDPEDGSST